MIGGNNQTGTVGQNPGSSLSAQLTDQYGNPISGQSITWVANSGNSSTVTTPSTTDGTGTAMATAKLGTKAGIYTYTASYNALSAGFSETAVPDAATETLSIVSGSGSSGTVGQALSVPLVVKVVDQYGNPFVGATVTWAATGGGGSVGAPSTTIGTNGQTSVTAFLGTSAGTDNDTFTATLGGQTVTFTETANAGAARNFAYVSGNNQSNSAGSPLGSDLVVEATDLYGNPVSGVSVTWAAATGGGSVSGTNPTTTGSNGQTSISAVLGTTAGTDTYTASAARLLGSPVTFTATATAGTAQNLVYVSGNNQSGAINTGLANPLVVKVTDQYGNPVSGTSVTWSVGIGGGSLTGMNPSTTGANGETSINATLGDTAGSNTFIATAGSLTNSPLTFTATAKAATVANLVAFSGNNQSGIVGTNLNNFLVVEATDSNGNPVPNVTVTWSAATGGGSTSPVSAVTGANGQASFFATLGNTRGTQTFSFSASGVPSLTFTATANVWQGTSLGGYVTQIVSALDKSGHLELFGIGGNGALWYNVQTSGSTFTGWTSLGGYVKQITVATQAGGLLAVFAIGGDNAAYLITQNVGGSWTPRAYTDLGGYVQQLSAALDKNGHLELFGIGGDNGVWYDVQTSGSTFGGWSPLGGYVKQITVGTNYDGTLQVFGVGGDNGAWYRKQHSTGNLTFDSWTPLGGYVNQLAIGLDPNHHLELFGIGGDHAIWTRAQTDNTGVNFNGWSSLGGYVTQISVTTDQADLDVFGIGGDSAIWYRKQNTANNLAFDPYARVAASVAQLSAVTDSNGDAALFAIGKAFSDGQFFDQV